MISTELLSEVLCVHVRDDWYFDCEILVYTYDKILGLDENYKAEINIYELAHKCKEWAYSQGYIISSGLTPVLGVNKDGWAEVFSSSTPLDGKLHTFKQLSEPEAIFKASEYILKEMR